MRLCTFTQKPFMQKWIDIVFATVLLYIICTVYTMLFKLIMHVECGWDISLHTQCSQQSDGENTAFP